MSTRGRHHLLSPTALAVLFSAFTINPLVAAPVDYEREIKPILKEHCSACHGALKQQSGLRVDTGASLRTGGDSGPAVIPGNPDQSLLLKVLTGRGDFQMPPEGEGSQLSAPKIELLHRWIAEGADSPVNERPDEDPKAYWSYQPVRRPDIPLLTGTTAGSPLDQFLATEHAKRGLVARPQAAKSTLLRRLTLDLIGLPPTRDELQEFLDDESPDARERAVDRLLANPLYGERWGRHWMDVWRYSDWYGSRAGNEIRYSQRHIWRWRDWIVESLNANHGYDRMLQEMLAGDELAPGDPDVIRATGFLGRNWYKFDRNVWMFETVEQTAQAFLATTLKCCRCHDHKFDPLAQHDYYRFRAFFEPHDVRTDPLTGDLSTEKDATLGPVLKTGVALVYDKQPDAKTFLFQRGDNRYPDESQLMSPGVPAVFGAGDITIQPIDLPLEAWFPSLKPVVLDAWEKSAAADVAQARKNSLDTDQLVAIAQAEQLAVRQRIIAEQEHAARLINVPSALSPANVPTPAALAAVQAERQAALLKAERDFLLAERELHKPASAVIALAQINTPAKAENAIQAKFESAQKSLEAARVRLNSTDGDYTPLGVVYPLTSTGRRTALAKWITTPGNPRTGRVAVNHIWLRHFGEAIVPTVANFGLNGQRPTHPELLDWLTAEFTDSGWDMKRLHRLIVNSDAYGRSTAEGPDPEHNLALDPQNRFLWRMNSRRMESEVVRDSVLALGSRLDIHFGGPEIPETQGEKSHRRSLYFRSTPNEKMTFLDVFDQANPNECYRRQESVMPQQALALSNSLLSLSQAAMLAESLVQDLERAGEPVQPSRVIPAAFERVLSRLPTSPEYAACEKLLARHASTSEPRLPLTAIQTLIHVLLNHNDFVTIR